MWAMMLFEGVRNVVDRNFPRFGQHFPQMSSDSFMFLFPDGFIFRFVTGLQIFFGV